MQRFFSVQLHMTNVASFHSISMRARKNFSYLALLSLLSAPIPRKGKRPSLNLGDDTNFFAQFECAPFQASYGEVSSTLSPFAVPARCPFRRIVIMSLTHFWGSPSSSVQDELIRPLLSFALRFPSRLRSLRESLSELFAQKMSLSQSFSLLLSASRADRGCSKFC